MENMRVDEPAASATGRVAAAVDCCPMRAYCGLWHMCNPQIVADYLGLLYNKDSVIAQLLSKKKFPKQLRHIKSLKVLAAAGRCSVWFVFTCGLRRA